MEDLEAVLELFGVHLLLIESRIRGQTASETDRQRAGETTRSDTFNRLQSFSQSNSTYY